jgi:acyl carrier protein
MSDVSTILAELIATVTRGRAAAAELDDATQLVSGGVGLDSVEILELVVAFEERLGVALTEQDLAPAHWATFGRLAALLTQRRAP